MRQAGAGAYAAANRVMRQAGAGANTATYGVIRLRASTYTTTNGMSKSKFLGHVRKSPVFSDLDWPHCRQCPMNAAMSKWSKKATQSEQLSCDFQLVRCNFLAV